MTINPDMALQHSLGSDVTMAWVAAEALQIAAMGHIWFCDPTAAMFIVDVHGFCCNRWLFRFLGSGQSAT